MSKRESGTPKPDAAGHKQADDASRTLPAQSLPSSGKSLPVVLIEKFERGPEVPATLAKEAALP